MNCKNVQSLLSAYIDEELSGREMLDIRHHLYECHSCGAELRCVEGVKQLLGSTPVPEPSEGFENRLVSRVLAATSVGSDHKRVSLFALTGIAAVSMLATMLLLNSLRREPAPITDQSDGIPYSFMRQDRAFDASANPTGFSPVMMRMDGRR